MSYKLDGLPYDLLDSERIGKRRLKTSAITVDSFGSTARNTLTQEAVTATRADYINVQFQYNLPVNNDATDIKGATTGSGELRHGQSMAQVATGTGAGTAHVVSRDSIRYFPGHEFAAEMTAFTVNAGAVGTRAVWGIGDTGGGGDALLFGLVDGVFGIVFRADGVEQFIPQSSFNGDSIDGINVEAMNLWTIWGGWYGILPIQFGVYLNGRYILCHTIDLTNSQQRPHLSNPSLPMFMEVVSDGAAGNDVQVQSSSWRGGIAGVPPSPTLADRFQGVFVEDFPLPGGTLTPIVSIRSKDTFQGKSNHVRARYATITLSTDGNKAVRFAVYKNATLTGAAFADQDAEASVVEVDTTATGITPTLGATDGTVLGKVESRRISVIEERVVIAAYPGETLTLAAESQSTSELNVFLRWVEEF